MRYLSTLLIIISILFMFSACEKQTAKTNDTDTINTAEMAKENPVKNVIEENKLKQLIVIENPNTMDLETTIRSASVIKAEKQKVEGLAEKILTSISDVGIDATMEEINKSTQGAFKDDLAGPFYYCAILRQIDEQVLVISAHATSRDYIGVEVNADKWQDLTGWKYFEEPMRKLDSGETNRIWIEGVYWKDPNWASGKPVQFDAYERFYKVGNENYLLHYCLFLQE
jgi:hypothetical protein